MRLMEGIVVVAIVVCMSLFAWADISDNWTSVRNVHSGAVINHEVNGSYYPISLYLDAVALSSKGGARPVREWLDLGTPANVTFDLDTDQGQRVWYQALPPIVQSTAKDLRLKATNTDISQ